MKSNRTQPWLPALLVLAGCTGDPPVTPPKTPQLGAVSVTCAPSALVLGQSTQCTASAQDEDGAPFSVPSFTWTSGDAARASVDASGKVTSQATGSVSIRASATSGDVTRQGEATLTVSARPPTLHSSDISSAETWRLADSPHEVRGQLRLSSSLTLEPGVVVLFASDAELRVSGGTLLAPGTPAQPISLVAPDASAQGAWRGLVFASSGSASRLEHTTLRGCGATSGEGACLALSNQAAPVLVDVSVDKSGSAGVVLANDGSAFGAGSARLSISGSATHALALGANQASSLPLDSLFSGNGRDIILLNGDVSRTQRWPAPPANAAYVIPGLLKVQGPPTQDPNPEERVTLTLSAGSTLRFGKDGELAVGYDYNPGDLIAEGSEAQPILFTADSTSTQRGQWRGVHLGLGTTPATRLAYTTLQYTGLPSALLNSVTSGLYVAGNYPNCGPCPVLQNLTVREGSGNGITFNNNAKFAPSSKGLKLLNNGGYALSLQANEVQTVPNDTQLSGNAFNGLQVDGVIINSQRWETRFGPYFLKGSIDVGFAPTPTLTLAPGVEVRFSQDAELRVGRVAGRLGVLIAEGTAAAPIQFVPDKDNAPKAYSGGLHFFKSGASKLDHVLVTHGGGGGQQGNSNVCVYNNPPPSITNSTFRRAAGCGIQVAEGTFPGSDRVTVDYGEAQYNNVFADNGGNFPCPF
jgi:hypothetical protein